MVNILFYFIYLFIYLFTYLFTAVLGLRFCARALSSCGEQGPLFIAVRGPLTVVASPVAEHRLQTRRLSNCGSRAQLLRGMWDLPRPGLEPASPALAGRLSATAPPGKPHGECFRKPWPPNSRPASKRHHTEAQATSSDPGSHTRGQSPPQKRKCLCLWYIHGQLHHPWLLWSEIQKD